MSTREFPPTPLGALNELSLAIVSFHRERSNGHPEDIRREALKSLGVKITQSFEQCLNLGIPKVEIVRTEIEATPAERRLSVLGCYKKGRSRNPLSKEELCTLAEEFKIAYP